jgi:exodeoxyribonuclease-1
VAFYSPQLLSTGERLQFEAWLRERWSAPDAPEIGWMAVASARRAIDEIRGKEGLDASLVAEIAAYLQGFDIIES